MAQGTKRNWSHDEAKLVLALYCQIPFGKMNATNPQIIAMAQHIGRTPASVTFKLVNFASMDPYHQNRGVGGLKNASKVDREIWDTYYGRWEALADLYPLTLSTIDPTKKRTTNSSADQVNGDIDIDIDSDSYYYAAINAATDAHAIVKIRRGQAFFRKMVLAAYDSKCCITGITTPQLLRASHILPWAKEPLARLDPHNGLALNVLHDTAFDQGLMTIRNDLSIQLSTRLPAGMSADVYQTYFHQYADKQVSQPQRFTPKHDYLTYHRENVFQN